MKVAFDTSVLVAGLVASHPSFSLATVWLDALDDGAHALHLAREAMNPHRHRGSIDCINRIGLDTMRRQHPAIGRRPERVRDRNRPSDF